MDDLILDVSESNFEQEVLDYSHRSPVIVEFWAEWSAVSKQLTPQLQRSAREAHGAFRLARVNVDQEKTLPGRYGVRSLPAVRAFVNGMLTAELNGPLVETRIHDLIKAISPTPGNLSIGRGQSLLARKAWAEARAAFSEALDQEEDNSAALYGYLTCLVAEGNASEALAMIETFPASREYTLAQNYLPLVQAYLNLEEDPSGEDELQATYTSALRLARRGNIYAALDGLLDVLRKNKRYLRGTARAMVVALLQVFGEEDEQARAYRSELAAILF
jgi:putative thioredoxin